jgi:hypothetical protein
MCVNVRVVVGPCSYLLFSPELRAQALEETFQTQAEIEDAVHKVAAAIYNIVEVAQKRGMKLQQVFRYFDSRAEGQVSREQFIANLVCCVPLRFLTVLAGVPWGGRQWCRCCSRATGDPPPLLQQLPLLRSARPLGSNH